MSIRWHEFNTRVVESARSQAASLGNELLRITMYPGMLCGDFVRVLMAESVQQTEPWVSQMLNAYALIFALKIARRLGRDALVQELRPLVQTSWNRFVDELDALPGSRPSSPTSVADIGTAQPASI